MNAPCNVQVPTGPTRQVRWLSCRVRPGPVHVRVVEFGTNWVDLLRSVRVRSYAVSICIGTYSCCAAVAVKLIGSRCDDVNATCCFCHDFVTHSHCADDGFCRCLPGYRSNDIGTTCLLELPAGDRKCNKTLENFFSNVMNVKRRGEEHLKPAKNVHLLSV